MGAPPRASDRRRRSHAVPPEVLVGDRGRIDDSHEFALVHDREAVGEGLDLVELRGDQQHAGARIAQFDQAVVDVLRRPDVDPSRWVGREHQARVALELAADHELLLVPPGE
jgi:hypothetical protein